MKSARAALTMDKRRPCVAPSKRRVLPPYGTPSDATKAVRDERVAQTRRRKVR